MGTPCFAVPTLESLLHNNYNVVAVVTQPDKPVGRHGSVLQPPAVKQCALQHGLPVLQPEKMSDAAFIEQLRAFDANLQVVVAFRILPEAVWAMPRYGTFNVHAALLPQYRGAAPINWAVINGETMTGVTTFFLDHDIDTGRIIHQVPSPIADTDTVGDVYDRLMLLGADLILKTVDDIEAGNIAPVEQRSVLGGAATEEGLRPAPKLFKENCEIRWSEHTVKSAYDFIRGLSPYPAAWTTLRTADGKETQLKVFFAEKCKIEDSESDKKKQGLSPVNNQTAIIIQQGNFLVGLRDGYLRLTDIQLAGKRRMPASDFLRGAHLDNSLFVESPKEDE